jgi:hypothetical protein
MNRIFIFQLNTCGCSSYVTASLMRGWVCRLEYLLGLASAVILRSESHGTHDHILLPSDSKLPQSGGPGPRIYIPQEQGCLVINPGTGFPFNRLLRLAGIRRKYSNPPPQGIIRENQSVNHTIYSKGITGQKTHTCHPLRIQRSHHFL